MWTGRDKERTEVELDGEGWIAAECISATEGATVVACAVDRDPTIAEAIPLVEAETTRSLDTCAGGDINDEGERGVVWEMGEADDDAAATEVFGAGAFWAAETGAGPKETDRSDEY